MPSLQCRIRLFASFVLVTMTTGCFGIADSIREAHTKSRELEVAPFVMPAEFPMPEDSTAISRPLKGSNVLARTGLQISEILDFYRKTLTAKGLYEYESLTIDTAESGSIVFAGWPNGCWLVIQSVDLAFSSSEDRRTISARLDRC